MREGSVLGRPRSVLLGYRDRRKASSWCQYTFFFLINFYRSIVALVLVYFLHQYFVGNLPFYFLMFNFFLAMPCCMRDLSSPARDPHPLQWKRRVLTTGVPGKSLSLFIKRRDRPLVQNLQQIIVSRQNLITFPVFTVFVFIYDSSYGK